MANLLIVSGTPRIILLTEQTVTLSGTVKNVEGDNLEGRTIIGYRNDDRTTVIFETTSASDGTWSATPNGNSNDKFRCIAIDSGSQNCAIFDDV